MKVSDLEDKSPIDELVLTIETKSEPRSVRGGSLTVCELTGKDDTGSVTITLWNDDIDKVKEGDKVKITEGWARIYNDAMQVSTGRRGTVEVVK